MRIAQRKPDVFPLPVDRAQSFQVGAYAIVEGYRYLIVGLDDATNTLFVRPVGKRKERRAAVRAVFR